MLGEQEPPTGPEDAGDLHQRRREVVDGAENQSAHRRVDGIVIEGEVVGGGFDHDRLDRASSRGRSRGPLAQTPGHRLERLGQDELSDRIGVVVEVESRSSPQLDRAAGGSGDELAAVLAHSSLLGLDHRPLVQCGEGPAPGRVVGVSADAHQAVPPAGSSNLGIESRR